MTKEYTDSPAFTLLCLLLLSDISLQGSFHTLSPACLFFQHSFLYEELNCLITSTFLSKRLGEKHSTSASNWRSSKSYLCFIFYM